MYDAHVEGAIAGLREWRLTTEHHGYIIADKSDEGRDAASPIEMENPS